MSNTDNNIYKTDESLKDKKCPDNPLEIVTTKFKPNKVIYDRNGFVIASGLDENHDHTYACRWHLRQGLGYPNGFGKPQWFILPFNYGDVYRRVEEDIDLETKTTLYLTLDASVCDPEKGDLALYKGSWWFVVNSFNDKIFNLKKSKRYKHKDCSHNEEVMVTREEIMDVKHPVNVKKENTMFSYKSLFYLWHHDNVCLWLNDMETPVLTYMSNDSDSKESSLNIGVQEKLVYSFESPSNHPFHSNWTWDFNADDVISLKNLGGWTLLKRWDQKEIFSRGVNFDMITLYLDWYKNNEEKILSNVNFEKRKTKFIVDIDVFLDKDEDGNHIFDSREDFNTEDFFYNLDGLVVPDQSLILACATLNVWHEARGEDELGRLYVSQTVRNRVKNSKYPNSVCGVVYQPGQFQWTQDDISDDIIINTPKDGELLKSIIAMNIRVYNGEFDGVLQGATYYYNPEKVKPCWIDSFDNTFTHGNHTWGINPNGSTPCWDRKQRNLALNP